MTVRAVINANAMTIVCFFIFIIVSISSEILVLHLLRRYNERIPKRLDKPPIVTPSDTFDLKRTPSARPSVFLNVFGLVLGAFLIPSYV